MVDLESAAVLVVLAFGQALPASLDSVATVLQSKCSCKHCRKVKKVHHIFICEFGNE